LVVYIICINDALSNKYLKNQLHTLVFVFPQSVPPNPFNRRVCEHQSRLDILEWRKILYTRTTNFLLEVAIQEINYAATYHLLLHILEIETWLPIRPTHSLVTHYIGSTIPTLIKRPCLTERANTCNTATARAAVNVRLQATTQLYALLQSALAGI
jgi:hypothetical protein